MYEPCKNFSPETMHVGKINAHVHVLGYIGYFQGWTLALSHSLRRVFKLWGEGKSRSLARLAHAIFHQQEINVTAK